MNCSVCGTTMRANTVKLEYITVTEYVCNMCGKTEKKITIRKDKKHIIFLNILKAFIEKNIFKDILTDKENYTFKHLLSKIDNKISLQANDLIDVKDYNEIEHLYDLRDKLIEKLDLLIENQKPVKTILEEIKLIDVNIQNAIEQKNKQETKNKVYLFEYDGVDHEL